MYYSGLRLFMVVLIVWVLIIALLHIIDGEKEAAALWLAIASLYIYEFFVDKDALAEEVAAKLKADAKTDGETGGASHRSRNGEPKASAQA